MSTVCVSRVPCERGRWISGPLICCLPSINSRGHRFINSLCYLASMGGTKICRMYFWRYKKSPRKAPFLLLHHRHNIGETGLKPKPSHQGQKDIWSALYFFLSPLLLATWSLKFFHLLLSRFTRHPNLFNHLFSSPRTSFRLDSSSLLYSANQNLQIPFFIHCLFKMAS